MARFKIFTHYLPPYLNVYLEVILHKINQNHDFATLGRFGLWRRPQRAVDTMRWLHNSAKKFSLKYTLQDQCVP
jgi:hypothetical protein